jgi:F-type H+-transporting ATPase subunit b
MYLLAAAEPIQLFPDGTIFIHIALILLMISVLNRTFYRPINRIIATREKSKGGNSSEAVGILKNVDEIESRYVKEMLEARSGGYELIEKEQKAALADRDKKIAQAKAEIAAKYEANKADLERRAIEERSAIESQADKIAEQIASSILRG